MKMSFRLTIVAIGLLLLTPGRGRAQDPRQANAAPQPQSESTTTETGDSETSNPFQNAIETDRDSFTPSTTTAGRGHIIFESAYSFLDNRRVRETHSFPEFLTRIGVGERLELRISWNYEVGGGAGDVSGGEGGEGLFGPGLERESQIGYGFKAVVTEQRRWLPQSALIIAGFTPTSGAEAATDLVATYVIGWEFLEDWKLDAAMRLGTDSERGDRFEAWAPSIVLKVPIAERWNSHVEYFGDFSSNKANDLVLHYVSPGLHYLVTPDLEIGVRLGWGLNEQSARFFSNVGFGWRY